MSQESVEAEAPHAAPSRRALVLGGAAAAAGLLVGMRFSTAAFGAELQARGAVLNAFVRVPPAGPVILTMPAVEMGQGVYTSLSMILAEELDVGLDQVVTEHAPPDVQKYGNPLFIVQATGGSTTTMAWYEPLRKAAATARAVLVRAAAARWGVDASALTVARGVVFDGARDRSASYGDLASGLTDVQPPADVPLKDPKAFTLIGTSARRLDTSEKATGAARYGIDVMLPGMTFAALASCPVFGGKLAAVGDTAARAIAGVTQIVVLDDTVAVVATNTWAAQRGLAALDVRWVEGANATLQQDGLWADLEAASIGPAVVAETAGNAAALLSEGALFEAHFELPLLAHAAMEPMNCTVHVRPDSCEVWVGTQVPGFAQSAAAAALGIDPSKVTVHNHLIGGGFGRRLEADGVAKAVRIAQHVDGPVKVTWTREEDIQQELYRPMYHDRLKARVENGRIAAWHHRVTGPSIMARWLPPAFQNGIDPDAVDGAVKQPYDFPNRLIEFVRHETAVPVTFWRGVGPNSNVFSAECFLAGIAAETGADPVAFRRSMLDNAPRARAVLDLVAQKAAWGAPATPPHGERGGRERLGRGFAMLATFGSYLACIADVAVADDGAVRVTRVVVAADVGVQINPNTLEAQVQGGVVFGVGAILYGEVTIDRGRVRQSNFHDYRLLRIDETPVIEVHLMPSGEPPGASESRGPSWCSRRSPMRF